MSIVSPLQRKATPGGIRSMCVPDTSTVHTWFSFCTTSCLLHLPPLPLFWSQETLGTMSFKALLCTKYFERVSVFCYYDYCCQCNIELNCNNWSIYVLLLSTVSVAPKPSSIAFFSSGSTNNMLTAGSCENGMHISCYLCCRMKIRYTFAEYRPVALSSFSSSGTYCFGAELQIINVHQLGLYS